MNARDRRQRYWQRLLRITGALLAVWALVTFGVAFFARELDFTFFGWPFGFWVGAQGALVVYCAIVWFYAHAVDQLERESGPDDHE
jgi:putative solute:sodium symporter small subunit